MEICYCMMNILVNTQEPGGKQANHIIKFQIGIVLGEWRIYAHMHVHPCRVNNPQAEYCKLCKEGPT